MQPRGISLDKSQGHIPSNIVDISVHQPTLLRPCKTHIQATEEKSALGIQNTKHHYIIRPAPQILNPQPDTAHTPMRQTQKPGSPKP